MTVRLELAIGVNDRWRALAEGDVHVEGLELEVNSEGNDGERHRRFLEGSYDACELDVGKAIPRCGHEREYLAVPVIPARKFRHSLVYLSPTSKIASPKDFTGRRVGINSWDSPGAIWTRAFLQHDFGVDLTKVEWVSRSSVESEVLDRIRTAGFNVISGDRNSSNFEQLIKGRFDALIATSDVNDPRAIRLFPNYMAIEQDFFERTRIVPIGHVVVIRRELCESQPLIPSLLIKAWEHSKGIAMEYDRKYQNHSNLMWSTAYEEDEHRLLGDPFSSNLDDHMPSLEALLTYAYEQGLTTERYDVGDVFV